MRTAKIPRRWCRHSSRAIWLVGEGELVGTYRMQRIVLEDEEGDGQESRIGIKERIRTAGSGPGFLTSYPFGSSRS